MTEPLVMQLSVTNRCNLQCIHCYEASSTFRDMTHQEFTTIVNKFLETARRWRKYPMIFLTGGEPLIHPDFWNLIQFLQEKRDTGSLEAYILTNGILLDEKFLNSLERYPVVQDIQISLDGTSARVHEAIRGAGTFKRTIDAIEQVSKSTLRTHIHMVVTKKNLTEAYSLPDLGVEIGADILTITRLVPFGRGKAMHELMLSPTETRSLYVALSEKQDAFERNGVGLEIARRRCDWPVLFYNAHDRTDELMKNGGFCQVGVSHFAVLEDGTVLPCRRLPIKIGNILHQDLKEIFNHPLLWQFRRKHTLMKGKCRSCRFNNDLWKYCSGGASCISYGYYGDPFMPDPQCPYPLSESEKKKL